ncbi:MAG: SusC/RagA family TonB-linked outer membrane protein, partial [Balneolales bacterium]|nr:SusC/RagA family TonB-linked outer membrane protein [Balneolales bacterium]
SFEQALQGRTPGVFITTGSGQPGSSATVRIRGTGSINSINSPLYVVDGIPINSGDFATMNPNDFESVTVLRDASATSIYGARGSNGVILIQTKRGRSGPSQVRYSGQLGVSQVGEFKFDMMDTEQKLDLEEFLRIGPGWATSSNNPNAPANAAAQRDSLLAINTQWDDVFFRNGITQQHNLSVSGGNERVRYFISGGIFEQEGIGVRTSLNRYSLRVNTDITATDRLDVGFSGSGAYSESSFTESEGGIALANPFAAVYLANPYEKLRDEDGNVLVGGGRTGANAFDRLDKDTNDRNEIKFVGSTYARLKLGEFVVGQEFGLDFRERYFSRWVNPNSYAGGLITQGNSGSLNRTTNRLTFFTSNTNVRYRTEFQGRHQLDLYVGNEFVKSHFQSFGYTGYGLNPALGATPASITAGTRDNNMIPSVGGSYTQNALWSIFGIADYSLDEKYNLRASIRRDGSSRFGPGNQYAWLWSVGTSWVASSEDFLADVDALSNLIVRLSYGITGNQGASFSAGQDFQRVATFASSSYAGQLALIPSAPGNDDLKWETAGKLNFGIDFGFLQNRLSGTVDLYREETSDLFITQSLSRTAGFASLSINAGSVMNSGVEVSLEGDVVRERDFVLTLNANYSYNKNEITDLGQVDEFELGTSIIRTGLPLGTHYIEEWAGVDAATGAPLYRDDDGNITSNFNNVSPKADFGSWLPTTTGGFGLDMVYKNFAIATQFNFAGGNKLFNNQRFFQENHGQAGFNQYSSMVNIWRQPGDITDVQSNLFGRQFSSKDIEDASYLRFRNLVVSYNIPGRVFNNEIRGVRLFVQGQNLYTWTKFTGFDPEDYNNISQYAYPLPRIFTGGIDINF